MTHPPYLRVSAALKEIATVLREEGEEWKAREVERLSNYALSVDPDYQELFLSEITRNKDYWGGMGTIRDTLFQDREQTRRFVLAYYELALACEAEGCGSIFSEREKESGLISLRRMEGTR